VTSAPVELQTWPSTPPVGGDAARVPLVQRARRLAWAGLAWHGVEAAVAVAAGAAVGSVALIGFGADSLIEAVAGVIVLWRFAAARVSSEHAERRAQRLIGASFYLIAAYVAVEAIRSLAGHHQPDASYLGIALAAVTVVLMPPLAIAKGKVGDKLASAATKSEGRQNMLCAYLSGALLVGLTLNAALGWWWADPITGLVIAGVAVREGRDAWRGEDACCAAPAVDGAPACADGCCE
jgi:divalent metal cation (Fe/Co/Zn/Cd) transporter